MYSVLNFRCMPLCLCCLSWVFGLRSSIYKQYQKVEEQFLQLKTEGSFTLYMAKTGGQSHPMLSCYCYDIKSFRQEVPEAACICIRPLQINFVLSVRKKVVLNEVVLKPPWHHVYHIK